MGYTPGLPPGIYAPHTPTIQRLSNIFEAAGLCDQYPESPISILYNQKTVVVHNAPQDVPLNTVASYIIESMNSRNLLSSPENKPIVHTFPESLILTMTFTTREDAIAALSLSDEISFRGNPLSIRPFLREADMPLPPMNIQSKHPRRVIAMNVDPDYIERFPDFLYDHFNIDGYLVVPTMKDCVLFDVCPPIAPESAVLMINEVQFGRFLVHAVAYRSITQRKSDINGEFNVLAEGVDLQQVIQPRTKITTAVDDIPSKGTKLKLLNVLPISSIHDDEENQIVIYDIADECKNYGKILNCTLSSKPEDGACEPYGVIIVEFETEEAAKNAQEHIAGRRYLGRVVVTMLC